jgi:hypothetical protein
MLEAYNEENGSMRHLSMTVLTMALTTCAFAGVACSSASGPDAPTGRARQAVDETECATPDPRDCASPKCGGFWMDGQQCPQAGTGTYVSWIYSIDSDGNLQRIAEVPDCSAAQVGTFRSDPTDPQNPQIFVLAPTNDVTKYAVQDKRLCPSPWCGGYWMFNKACPGSEEQGTYVAGIYFIDSDGNLVPISQPPVCNAPQVGTFRLDPNAPDNPLIFVLDPSP